MQEHTKVEQVYFSIPECARVLGASPQTIRRFIESGQLPALRVPGSRIIRIRKEDLENLFVPENLAVVEAQKRVKA